MTTTGQDRRAAEVRRVQELRRSSAARPVPSGKQYQRRPKHRRTTEMKEN